MDNIDGDNNNNNNNGYLVRLIRDGLKRLCILLRTYINLDNKDSSAQPHATHALARTHARTHARTWVSQGKGTE